MLLIIESYAPNPFVQLFKSWPPGRAAGGKFLKSTELPCGTPAFKNNSPGQVKP